MPGTITPIVSGSLPPIVSNRRTGAIATSRTPAPVFRTPPYNPNDPPYGDEITITPSPWQTPLNIQLRRFLTDVENALERIFGDPVPDKSPSNQSKSVAPPAVLPPKKSGTTSLGFSSASDNAGKLVDMFGGMVKQSDYPDPYQDTGTASGNEPAGVGDAPSEKPRDIADDIATTIEAGRRQDAGDKLVSFFIVALAILLIILGLYFARGGSTTRLVNAAQEGATQ